MYPKIGLGLLVLLGLCLSVQSQEASASRDIYESIRQANLDRLPGFFSARVTSGVVKLQLKNIPEEMVEFGKKPQLYFYFKKDYSPRLILNHVTSFYRNFFSPYEEILSRSGLFLGVDSRGGYKDFTKQFEVMEVKSVTEGVRITIREREGLPGDYAVYFYNKTWSVQRALFYEANEETTEVKFYYTNKNGYQLPKRMLIYVRGENALLQGSQNNEAEDHFVINFVEYGFNANVAADIGL